MLDVNSTMNEIRSALKSAGVTIPKAATRSKLEKLARSASLWAAKRDRNSSSSTRSVIPAEYKQRYGKGQSCGDEVAEALKDCDVASVAAANEVDAGRWRHLNAGQQRMCLGNVLRAKIRGGDYVTINGHEFNRDSRDRARTA